MIGRSTSCAAASTPCTSTPVLMPSRSNVAASTSVGALPAPAPSAHSAPSTWRAPPCTASTLLATPERQVLVPVEADLRLGADLRHQRLDPGLGVGQDQRAGRVDDVDALRARVHHDPGLPGQLGRADPVR
jgi:hypothetical protein